MTLPVSSCLLRWPPSLVTCASLEPCITLRLRTWRAHSGLASSPVRKKISPDFIVRELNFDPDLSPVPYSRTGRYDIFDLVCSDGEIPLGSLRGLEEAKSFN